MKKPGIIEAAIVVCILATAVPARGQEASFAIGDSKFQLPIPTGFCSPDASASAQARKVFGANPETIFVMFLSRCDAPANDPLQDYVVITAPTRTARLSIPRKDLLANLAAEFDHPQYREFIRNEVSQAAPDIQASRATTIELSGSAVPLGHDDVCLYLAGKKPPRDNHPYETRVGACMTSANNKVLSVYRYADPRLGKDFGSLLREARAMALSIRY